MGDLLIGPDLLRRRPPKGAGLPYLGGAKRSAWPTQSDLRAGYERELALARSALITVVREARAVPPDRLPVGVWEPAIGRVRLRPPHRRAAFSRIPARLHGIAPDLLLPEEALLLMEAESLLIRDAEEGPPLSLQQAYNALLRPYPPGPSLDQFLVYMRLQRLGWRLRRHGTARLSSSEPQPQADTSAAGREEELELDLRLRPQYHIDPGLDYSCRALLPGPEPRPKTWAELKRRQRAEVAPTGPVGAVAGPETLVAPEAVAALTTAEFLKRLTSAGPHTKEEASPRDRLRKEEDASHDWHRKGEEEASYYWLRKQEEASHDWLRKKEDEATSCERLQKREEEEQSCERLQQREEEEQSCERLQQKVEEEEEMGKGVVFELWVDTHWLPVVVLGPKDALPIGRRGPVMAAVVDNGDVSLFHIDGALAVPRLHQRLV